MKKDERKALEHEISIAIHGVLSKLNAKAAEAIKPFHKSPVKGIVKKFAKEFKAELKAVKKVVAVKKKTPKKRAKKIAAKRRVK